jgi:ubiquinone/menaquinone biosynthesis C-methylase UbiE
MGASAREWERFGREDAYFGVLSQEQYRRDNLDDATRARFFESGETHVAWVLGRIRDRTGAEFSPRSVLDYGCGVGRVVLGFAEEAERAVGVDVSRSMLAEARRNAEARGLTNVDLVEPPSLDSMAAEFDLVHCGMVLQHIPRREGLRILDRLLGIVRPGGVAVVQVPFGVSHWTASAFSHAMRLPLAHNLVNLVRRRPWSYPYMEMNLYSSDLLLRSVLDQQMQVLDLMLERDEPSRWRYDSCWLFASRPASSQGTSGHWPRASERASRPL